MKQKYEEPKIGLELIFDVNDTSRFLVRCSDCNKENRFILLDGSSHKGYVGRGKTKRLLTKIKHDLNNEL